MSTDASSSPDTEPSHPSPSAEESEQGPETNQPDAGESSDDARASSPEELEEELERLRAEVTRLRARQAAAEHASWFHRHPGVALFLTTTLGAAAGYVAARVGTPDDAFSEKTREQLRRLADQARDVASEVQHEIEARTRALRDGEDAAPAPPASGDGAPASQRTPAGDASAGASGRTSFGESAGEAGGGSLAEEAVERVVGTARKAKSSVRNRARSATQDAAERAVRSFASEDDVVPVEMKAKAAGMAASTLGAALARKLLRSAGRVATSMLLAYVTKKVLDLVRGR